MKTLNFLVCCAIILLLSGCGGSDEEDPQPNCDSPPTISVSSTSATSSCTAEDGSITVAGSGGTEPLEFSIDGSSFQASGEFTNLAPGTYTLLVRDAEGCTSDEVEATVDAGGTDLTASISTTADTQCFQNNGTIEITASGGEPPYEFSIGDGFGSDASFSSLSPGSYDVITRDATGCSITATASVERGDTGTSYENDIKPIILANCAISGCHNGDNGADKDWTDFSLFQSNAQEVKTRTQNGSMPQTGSITEQQKALIACWVDEGAKDN